MGSSTEVDGPNGTDSEGLAALYEEINDDDDDARLIYVNNPEKNNQFAGNSIRTRKYSILTFLPHNLFEQFHRVAYIFFIVIAILNQLPQLAVFGRVAPVTLLALLLLITAIKDAHMDYKRYQLDKIENNRLAWGLVDEQFQQIRWKDIHVGDIVKVSANETIPCDIVLLSTSDGAGVAYMQTTGFDGEFNLRTRYAKQETQMKNPENKKISGLIKCAKPNRNIYGFQAHMIVDGRRIALGPSNIMLRSCELKNTDWAVGVAVYAGRETKVMLNCSEAPSRRSRLETRMNREIIFLSVVLAAMGMVVSICHGVWLRHHKNDLDLMQFYRRKDYSEAGGEDYNYYGWGMEIFFVFLMSVIVFQIMIPLSLYVSMELVRVGQAFLMIRDNQMYDEASNSRLRCGALNINEDLGQIKYVFSDKTGTLTENKMEFQCASIGGVDYSSGKDDDEDGQIIGNLDQAGGQVLRPKMKVKVDLELLNILKRKHTSEGRHVREFFLALAACNTIVPLTVETPDPAVKLIDYQGESPDEQALVYAAAAYGFMLINRASGHLDMDIHGERQRFNVLGLHEFDSDRRRMSVILGCPDKTIKLFVKGADTSIFSVIHRSLDLNTQHMIKATEAHLLTYSSKGLRTLVFGMRELSPSEFEQWQPTFDSAYTALMGRAALLREVASKVEHHLSILGVSGIEDKLQQGVPDAIESLRTAGIKVWVLTGDKLETAISVGYSSKILTSKMTQIVINNTSAELCRNSLQDALLVSRKFMAQSDATSGESQLALVVDGTSLVHILDTELEEELFQLASKCGAVLCCRVTPFQKSGIVDMIKTRIDDMILAIGDGVNDVSMIHRANVGIGIRGQEGRQAAMASDFAIGEFRFLVPLLLVHGHWNYRRMSYMILFNFYKNAVFVLVLFWYVLFTSFTPTTAITDWSSVLYSVIYTSIPSIIVGILDKGISRASLLKHPQLYGAGHRQESYNGKMFWVTMLDALWQSVAAFFVPLLVYWGSDVDGSSLGDVWTLAVVIIVNVHLAMDVAQWCWITHAAIWGSIIVTFFCVLVIDLLPWLPGYWAFFHIAKTELFWVCLLCTTITALIPRFVVKAFIQYYRPNDIRIAREAEKFANSREAQIEMNQR